MECDDMEEKKQKEVKWHENANVVTSWMIGVILLTIILSQSFAVMGNGSLSLFSSVINHNTIYLLVLIYFVFLKTKFGKKYFNYLNIFLIFIFFIASLTSVLTVIQSFSLNTILSCMENLLILIYLVHTMLRDTPMWKDFHMSKSPFNEIPNDSYLYALIVIVVFSLIVNLVSTVVVSGLFLSILDAVYIVLLGRYIYLYREYLDSHQLDVKNEGNFEDFKKEVLDATTLDEKVSDFTEKVIEGANDLMNSSEKKEKKEVKKKNATTGESKRRGRPKKEAE
jgi:hypothetical protein